MSRPLPAADQALQSPPWWAAHWTGWPGLGGNTEVGRAPVIGQVQTGLLPSHPDRYLDPWLGMLGCRPSVAAAWRGVI